MHWLIVNGELVLYGFVGNDIWGGDYFTPRDVLDALLLLDGDITVRLNSGGGVAMDGLAIYNALKLHNGKVTIIVDGAAVSAASLIAMAGDTVIMSKGSLMMIHDPAVDVYGANADEMQSATDFLNKMADQFAEIYAAKAGIDISAAREIMKAETWYTADEAVAAGFADEAAGIDAQAVALFDYRLYQKAPAMLTALATASASLLQPKAALAAQPQETSMTLEQLIAMLAARFKTPAADVTMLCNQAMTAGLDLAAVIALFNPATVASMSVAKDVLLAKLAEPKTAPAQIPVTIPAAVPTATMSVTDIRDLQNRAASHNISLVDFNAIIAAHPTKDAAAMAIIDKVAEMHGTKTPSATAHVVEDARDKFREGAGRALMMKAGLEKGERNEFSGLSLTELARASLVISGHTGANKMDRMLMIGTAFTGGAFMAGGMHSTSDFAYILQNVASKSALKGFQEAEETFQLWTSKGQASDFKTLNRVDLGLFPTLEKVAEGAEFKYAKLSDRGVAIAIDTYGKLVAITRQAIINDDMNMLDGVPKKMGRAAKRTIGNLVYAILNSNANLADGVALFHATHANLAGTAAAPSEASFQAGVKAMQAQKDADSIASALNINPKYFLSAAYQFSAKQLLESSGSLTDSKNAGVVNTVQGLVTPITDARITGNQWFFAADPNQHDTVEITYLDGVEEPTLETKDGWTIDGTELKVRLDVGVNVLDHRGLYKNAGP